MIKTYVDANALIAAFGGNHPASEAALGVLGDPERCFVATGYLRLETLRKPMFYARNDEIAFMEAYFAEVAYWVPASDLLTDAALKLAARYDLGAMDALHAAAAMQAGAELFVTLERPTKPLHRLPGLTTLSLHPNARDGS
jgi:hypothetical protein